MLLFANKEANWLQTRMDSLEYRGKYRLGLVRAKTHILDIHRKGATGSNIKPLVQTQTLTFTSYLYPVAILGHIILTHTPIGWEYRGILLI